MKLVTQAIIITILTVFSVLVIAVILADTPEPSVGVIQQGQPQQEPYIAPKWVINSQGQRCIKQDTTVTCG